MIKHLAYVEAAFTARAQGRPDLPPSEQADAEIDEWEWALSDAPEQLYALWYDSIHRSQTAWAEMIKDDGLDVIVEENLIHLGHVDLLRESIDAAAVTAGRNRSAPMPEDKITAQYTVRALDSSTWDDFADLVERNGGVTGRCRCQT